MSSIIKAHTLGIDGANAMVAMVGEPVQAAAPPDAMTTPPEPQMRPCQGGYIDLIRKARQQAQTLLAAAQTEAERLKEQVRAEGFAEGLRQGREQGLREGTAEGTAAGWGSGVEQAQATLRTAQETLAAAEEERRQMFTNLEGQIVDLAFLIAEKIVQHQIDKKDPFIIQLINNALQQVPTSGRVVARLHPIGAEQIAQSEGNMESLTSAFQVLVDDSLKPGDCVIESEEGILDGRLDTRFSAIRQALEPVVAV